MGMCRPSFADVGLKPGEFVLAEFSQCRHLCEGVRSKWEGSHSWQGRAGSRHFQRQEGSDQEAAQYPGSPEQSQVAWISPVSVAQIQVRGRITPFLRLINKQPKICCGYSTETPHSPSLPVPVQVRNSLLEITKSWRDNQRPESKDEVDAFEVKI